MLKGLARVDYSESEGSQMNNSFQFKLVAEDTKTNGIFVRYSIDDISVSITSDTLDGFNFPQCEPSRKRKAPAPVQQAQVKYHKLSEVEAPVPDKSGVLYNIYGVITSYSQPRSTKGKDAVTLLTVIDESETSLDLVLFFQENSSPVVLRVGDVVRIHRFQVVVYNGKLQGNKAAGTAILLFDGAIGDSTGSARSSVKPYQAIPAFQGKTANYTFTPDDTRRVCDLAQWGLEYLRAPIPPIIASSDQYLRNLSTLDGADEADLYCRIVGFDPPRADGGAWSIGASGAAAGQTDLAILVWDGLDLPPTFPQQAARPPDAPGVGSVLRITCSTAPRLILAALSNPSRTPDGAYVRLRHVIATSPPGPADPTRSPPGARLDSMSAVMVLPAGHVSVQQIEQAYRRREAAAAGAAAAPITAVSGAWGVAAISPLSDVVARAGAGGAAAAGKFHCRVNVVGYEPGDVQGFVRYSRLQRR